MVFDPSKTGKTVCACGNLAETFGGQCDRCASLQMLGLGIHASSGEIEDAYHTLVRVWHPDRFPADSEIRLSAEEKLKEINAAHDYLVSAPRRPEPKPAAPVQEEEFADDAPETELETVPKKSKNPRFFEGEPDSEESEEVRRILRRQKRSIVPKLMLRVGFAIGAVALAALIWFSADAILSSNEKTQRWWEQTKTDLGREVHSTKERLAPDSDKSQPSSTDSTPATPAPADPATSAPVLEPKEQPAKGSAHVKGAQPYVTSGLTPLEVLTALGKPTSSTGEKMFYGASEIDFKNGQVAGWKLDSKAPIRVKLWPDTAVAPGMNTFAVGSSKSDVISIQGTPTLFSDNEFGYGDSLVFFQNNRVVSWKEDPASIRLRVPH